MKAKELVKMAVLSTGNKTITKLPIAFTVIVTVIEVSFVVLLSYLASVVAMNMMSEPGKVSSRVELISQAPPSNVKVDFSNLVSVDAFFGGSQNQNTQTMVIAPESTLDLKVYGLRTSENGQGTAILKPQGEAQKLYRIGENVTDTVRLTSVHHDRIEISRNGQAETIYLDKERSRKLIKTEPQVQVSHKEKTQKIDEIIASLDLNPFRRNNRISGFVVGEGAETVLLAQAGLETGDILHEVNGEELISWERLQEISESANDVGLNIKFERHGDLQTITLSNLMLGLSF